MAYGVILSAKVISHPCNDFGSQQLQIIVLRVNLSKLRNT
jgi:hypothetical protein